MKAFSFPIAGLDYIHRYCDMRNILTDSLKSIFAAWPPRKPGGRHEHILGLC